MRSDVLRPEWFVPGRRLAAVLHPYAIGGGLLAVAAVVETIVRVAPADPEAAYLAVLCLLAAAATLPLALLRPIPAALAITAASLLSLAVADATTLAGAVALVVALHRLGRHRALSSGGQVAATALALPFLVIALAGSSSGAGSALPLVVGALAPTAIWIGIAQRARAEADEHRVTEQVVSGTLLEHTARGERARIARELHDVVAHHISMVAVQAETARLTTPGMPDAGAQRLSAIGDTARAALTEMRRLLGVLREDAETEAPELAPQPGLRQLNELLDEARAASGAGTRLIVRGSMAALDPGVELAAYRIVQEALTNARRHAPGAATDVEVRYGEDALWLRIRDNGPGPDPARASVALGGHGLAGMRERAAAVGGELRAGAAANGGFLVEATLPADAPVAG